MNVCPRRYDISRFTKAPQGRPVAVRFSEVEELAFYLRSLPWRGIKSQPGRRFEDETKRLGINIGQAEDEKARQLQGLLID